MTPIAWVMACFALLGALDLIIGDKFGLGGQFKRGLSLLGTMAMSMVGMLVLAPLIAHLLRPAVDALARVIPFEPSVVPAMILANDMGGAPLAMEFATSEQVGYFNALVISAMMGATISFNIPFSMGAVPKEKHEPLLLGILCGIITTPVGGLVGGIVARVPFADLMASIIPLLVFAVLLAVALFLAPSACVKVFKVFGTIINIIIIIGLAVGIFEALTGVELIPYTAPVEDAFDVCVNAAMVMSGAFPLVFIVSKLLDKPMRKVGEKIGINATSAIGFLSTLATNVTTFGNMQDMDDKGAMFNSAFAVSAAFVFAGHLAFTLSFNAGFVTSMIVAKLVAGVSAVAVAVLLYRIMQKRLAEKSQKVAMQEKQEELSSCQA